MNRWELELTLRSPLHVGSGNLGMLRTCHCYLPGRLIWAALTNELVSTSLDSPARADYQHVGQQLGPAETHYGTLFPVDPQRPDTIWRPHWQAHGLCMERSDHGERLSIQDFRSRLVFSMAGQCMDYERYATVENSLHADELVAPCWRHLPPARSRPPTPVRFCGQFDLPGSITMRDHSYSLDRSTLTRLLSSARFGGGRKRGWGQVCISRLELTATDRLLHAEEIYADADTILLTTARPVVETDDVHHGRAYLAVNRQYAEATQGGDGRGFSPHRLCWEIGSTLTPQPDR